MDLLARPRVEIVYGICHDLAAEASPLGSRAVDAFAFKGALPDAEIFGCTRRAKVALRHWCRSLVATGGGQSATGDGQLVMRICGDEP